MGDNINKTLIFYMLIMKSYHFSPEIRLYSSKSDIIVKKGTGMKSEAFDRLNF